MKVARWIPGAVIALIAIWFGLLLLTADMGVVTTHYVRLEEARADNLFARGWSPDILPESSRDITTNNDVSFNTSNGEFHFRESDFSAFVSQLSPFSPLHTPDLAGYVRRMQQRGYQVGVFAQDGQTWLFLCKATDGYCEYTMGLDRVETL
jgi:hypothetical protein